MVQKLRADKSFLKKEKNHVQGHITKSFGTNFKVLSRMCNRKTHSPLVQKLWQRLGLLYADNGDDKNSDDRDILLLRGATITSEVLFNIVTSEISNVRKFTQNFSKHTVITITPLIISPLQIYQ